MSGFAIWPGSRRKSLDFHVCFGGSRLRRGSSNSITLFVGDGRGKQMKKYIIYARNSGPQSRRCDRRYIVVCSKFGTTSGGACIRLIPGDSKCLWCGRVFGSQT